MRHNLQKSSVEFLVDHLLLEINHLSFLDVLAEGENEDVEPVVVEYEQADKHDVREVEGEEERAFIQVVEGSIDDHGEHYEAGVEPQDHHAYS